MAEKDTADNAVKDKSANQTPAAKAQADSVTKDRNARELPDGGVVLEPKAEVVADNASADTDFADRTVRSQEQATLGMQGKKVDPREVVDKDHVEVAGGEVVEADPTEPAAGTLLPKDPGAPPQGTNPGAHVPAAKRFSASGQPLN